MYQLDVPGKDLLGQHGRERRHLGSSSRLDVDPAIARAGTSVMHWHLHTASADAYSDSGTHRRYEIARPHEIRHYFLCRCNGMRLANVESVEEGIRLCEWVERATTPSMAEDIAAAVPTTDELAHV